MQLTLQQMFDSFLEKEPFFIDKEALQATHNPTEILHREKQMTALAKILAPALRGDMVSNVFIYGKTGTGKTVATRKVCAELQRSAEKNGRPVDVVYINVKQRKAADTEYRLWANLAEEFGVKVPTTGLPTERIYDKFMTAMDTEKRNVLLVLDEIDTLIQKTGDEVLYSLTRMNTCLTKTKVNIIGITNDLHFLNKFNDPRIKSSLAEEEIMFPPYDALQLQDILNARAARAFGPGALDAAVIPTCAAYAAREHGDARRALDLLRIAGELAERNSDPVVAGVHVDAAVSKLDCDHVVEFVQNQPLQSKAILYSILNLRQSNPEFSTGHVYENYRKLCDKRGYGALTQRRVSDLISELDAVGIINCNVVSKGRYGRTRQINLSIDQPVADRVFGLLHAHFAG